MGVSFWGIIKTNNLTKRVDVLFIRKYIQKTDQNICFISMLRIDTILNNFQILFANQIIRPSLNPFCNKKDLSLSKMLHKNSNTSFI